MTVLVIDKKCQNVMIQWLNGGPRDPTVGAERREGVARGAGVARF